MTEYFNTLKSGNNVSKSLRNNVNETLTRIAGYLVTEGGYKKYEEQLGSFKPEDSLKYLEKIMTEEQN